MVHFIGSIGPWLKLNTVSNVVAWISVRNVFQVHAHHRPAHFSLLFSLFCCEGDGPAADSANRNVGDLLDAGLHSVWRHTCLCELVRFFLFAVWKLLTVHTCVVQGLSE